MVVRSQKGKSLQGLLVYILLMEEKAKLGKLDILTLLSRLSELFTTDIFIQRILCCESDIVTV